MVFREKTFIVQLCNCFHSHGTTLAAFKNQQMISRRKWEEITAVLLCSTDKHWVVYILC